MALGYRADVVKRYFLDYYRLRSDLTVTGDGSVEVHDGERDNWRIHLVDTGITGRDRLAVMAAGAVVAEGTVAEITGDATVTIVETPDLAEALDALDRAGLPGVALVGRSLRVPGAGGDAVEQALAGLDVRTRTAPATLEERFFELVA